MGLHHSLVVLCDGLGDAMLSSGRQALGMFTTSPRDQRSTQPFGNCLMGFSAFESTDDLGALAIFFEGCNDLFYPAVLLAQVVLLLLQVFVLPLQSLNLSNHLLFCRFGMNFVMTAISHISVHASFACRFGTVALDSNVQSPRGHETRKD